MGINLFTNYYVDKSLPRQKEIDLCVRNNLNNPLINFILIESQDRLKYDDYFRVVNNYTGSDDINIIANLDIYFDSTVQLVQQLPSKHAYALGRWDLKADGTIKHSNRCDSQDAWVFKGTINKVMGDFNLGLCGCDNRLAYELHAAGYTVINPSLSIKAIHAHASDIRNYKVKGRQRKQFQVPPPYATVHPTELSKLGKLTIQRNKAT